MPISVSRNNRHVHNVTFHSMRCHGLSALLWRVCGVIPALIKFMLLPICVLIVLLCM